MSQASSQGFNSYPLFPPRDTPAIGNRAAHANSQRRTFGAASNAACVGPKAKTRELARAMSCRMKWRQTGRPAQRQALPTRSLLLTASDTRSPTAKVRDARCVSRAARMVGSLPAATPAATAASPGSTPPTSPDNHAATGPSVRVSNSSHCSTSASAKESLPPSSRSPLSAATYLRIELRRASGPAGVVRTGSVAKGVAAAEAFAAALSVTVNAARGGG